MTGALEYRIASCGEKYRPEFRRLPNPRWWFMRPDGKSLEFSTATAAKAAADRIVELDEASRAPAHIIEVEPSPFESHAEWRAARDADAVAERRRVFGFSGPQIVRDCKGNHVEVVTKGRARA